jgi:hypothetical protein
MLTYESCARLFATARYPENGKPLSSSRSRYRLFKEGENFVVKYWGTSIAYVSPDDMLRLASMPYGSEGHVYDKFFGIIAYRRAYKRYSLGLRSDPLRPRYNWLGWDAPAEQREAEQKRFNGEWRKWLTALPEWNENIQFNMRTNEFVGAVPYVPPAKRPENREVAREWRRKVTAFRKFWDVSSKMGVFETQVGDQDHIVRYSLADLRHMIETMDVSRSQLAWMIKETAGWWYMTSNVSPEQRARAAALAFKRIYARLRPELRELVGCYA